MLDFSISTASSLPNLAPREPRLRLLLPLLALLCPDAPAFCPLGCGVRGADAQPLVVVVQCDGEHALDVVLPDDVAVQVARGEAASLGWARRWVSRCRGCDGAIGHHRGAVPRAGPCAVAVAVDLLAVDAPPHRRILRPKFGEAALAPRTRAAAASAAAAAAAAAAAKSAQAAARKAQRSGAERPREGACTAAAEAQHFPIRLALRDVN
eukprot:scaffold2644_cov63-Phaeocystis_antarctica.AAC.14